VEHLVREERVEIILPGDDHVDSQDDPVSAERLDVGGLAIELKEGRDEDDRHIVVEIREHL